MTAHELSMILDALPSPCNTHVYFKIPNQKIAEVKDEIGVTTVIYNDITKELILGCYDSYLEEPVDEDENF